MPRSHRRTLITSCMALIASAVLLVSTSSTAFADAPIRQGGNFGIGLGNGTSATGLSAKYFLSGSQALQGTLGVHLGGDYLGVGADYLWEMPEFVQSSPANLGWNLGAGAGLGLGSGIYFGASFIAGLEFNFNPVPIDLVLEYRPTVNIISGGDLIDLVDFSGHVRFYF